MTLTPTPSAPIDSGAVLLRAPAPPVPRGLARLRWALADTWVLTRRNLAHVRQVPEKLLDVTLQPIMFTLLFAYVFGGAIHVPGTHYRDYLIGGILVQTLGFGMMGPGVAIATDISEGVVDRFRSLPMARSAYLLGHLLAEFMASMLALTILAVTGAIIGWRIDAGLGSAIGGFALLVLFALTMIWTGTFVGLCVRTPDAVQGLAFMLVFPLTFVASTFVPLQSLPHGLRVVAEWNPFSAVSAAVRHLFGNPTATPLNPPWPLDHPVLCSALWCVGILAVVIPLTLHRYQRRTTG